MFCLTSPIKLITQESGSCEHRNGLLLILRALSMAVMYGSDNAKAPYWTGRLWISLINGNHALEVYWWWIVMASWKGEDSIRNNRFKTSENFFTYNKNTPMWLDGLMLENRRWSRVEKSVLIPCRMDNYSFNAITFYGYLFRTDRIELLDSLVDTLVTSR